MVPACSTTNNRPVPSSVDCRSTGLENPETTGVSVTLLGGGVGGGGTVVVRALLPHAARTSTKPNANGPGEPCHITIEIRPVEALGSNTIGQRPLVAAVAWSSTNAKIRRA